MALGGAGSRTQAGGVWHAACRPARPAAERWVFQNAGGLLGFRARVSVVVLLVAVRVCLCAAGVDDRVVVCNCVRLLRFWWSWCA